MDPTRFDALARSLTRLTARRPTRRLLLQVLGGGLLAGGLASAPDVLARKGKGRRRRRCKGGKTRCSGSCFDLNTDPSNCGTCDTVCSGGQTCSGGLCGGGCTPVCAGKACGASDDCGGQCSNGSCPDGQTCGGGGTPNQCGEGCTPSCADKECGGDGCSGTCGPLGGACPTGQTCRDNGKCVNSGGNNCDPKCGFNEVCTNGSCVAAPNHCSGPTGICNADPTPCGTSATGETCGCESTVEGNNFCANGTDPCTAQECTTSQDCRDTVGFHFFCQEAKRNAQGQFCGCGFGTATGKVCVAECDNPTVTFSRKKQRATSRRKRGRRG